MHFPLIPPIIPRKYGSPGTRPCLTLQVGIPAGATRPRVLFFPSANPEYSGTDQKQNQSIWIRTENLDRTSGSPPETSRRPGAAAQKMRTGSRPYRRPSSPVLPAPERRADRKFCAAGGRIRKEPSAPMEDAIQARLHLAGRRCSHGIGKLARAP